MTGQFLGRDERFYPRLRRRTALATAVIFLIPFALFYGLVDYVSVRYVRSQIYAQLQAGVATNVQLFDDVLDVRVREVKSLAQALSPVSSPLGRWPGMLRGFVEGNPWYWLFVVAEPSGQIVAASEDIRGNIKDRDYFRQALAGETVVSDVFFSPLTQKAEMVVAAPLRGRGDQAVGILVAALKLDKLNSRLLDLGIGHTGESFLVNAAGQFASPSRFGGQVLTGPTFDPQGPNPYQGEAGMSEHRDYRGQVVLSAYRKLRSKNYYLVAQVTRGEILAPIQELRRAILLYVAPFFLLGVALAVGAGHYAVNYMEKLTAELRQALQIAQEREHERDLAHQELARRFEEECKLAKEKAQFQAQLANYEKYAALAQLALGAAHEINNPLLGILSYLELELKTARSGEERAEIEQCIEAAKRISSTIRGLLNYARPSPLQLSKISLDRLVNDTFAFLCHQPLFRGIKLEKKIPLGLPAISADANQISQVLMNLLLNAAEATSEGGTISISAEKVKFAEKVEICITDTGCGIRADILPHIFDPFFTTKRGKGTGLGLSITQTYVRNHRGDIRVESIPQRGTIVRITLPIRQEGWSVPETEEVVT